MKQIDLRSDTVTHPTPAMMQAMAKAELGDDVWEDDPTTKQLEALTAVKLGMEASLFVPSGTMGNLIASLVHCQRGDELIVGDQAHIFRWEGGNVAAVGGVHPYIIPNQPDGTLALADISAAVRVEDVHLPRTRAIALENTHNGCGGIAIAPDYFAAVRQIAGRQGLAIHLDGARLFNAVVALNVPVTAVTQHLDSVMVCLSKGLCAPIGSMLAGSSEFIYKARRIRKMLGGGMRQVGVIAAAGIVALEEMVERLEDDHRNAAALAEGLQTMRGITMKTAVAGTTPTNMVYFKLNEEAAVTPATLTQRLQEEYNVLVDITPSGECRLVTHYWVTAVGVATTLDGFQAILG